MRVSLRESVLPIILLLVVASVLVPMPPTVLDCLIIINFLMAVGLVVVTLQLTESLQLSSLPTILLLGTLFRLCLNVSSTRMILTHGDGGSVIEAFGSFVLSGSVGVGCIIFAMLTIIQFIVVAKGSERVAEVAARFTLDALPGKQMAIDADVRAGLYDMQVARQKRQDLQTESRFFGALDGAMKFVKGDAIAGIVIVLINGAGGIVFGLMSGLSFSETLHHYSVLTVGDGIASQIPSLLNSIAAGLVVTRVSGGTTLSGDLVAQLFGSPMILKVGTALLAVLAFLPGFPTIPLLIVSAAILIGMMITKRQTQIPIVVADPIVPFKPNATPLLLLRIPELSIELELEVRAGLEEARRSIFDKTGILLTAIAIERGHFSESTTAALVLRGCIVTTILVAPSTTRTQIANEILEFCTGARTELIDDTMVRRLLDWYEPQLPELVGNTVPHVISLTQLSELLRSLAAEDISLKPFDVLLQAVSELTHKVSGARPLSEEVRTYMRRYVCAGIIAKRSERRVNIELSDPRIHLALLSSDYESLQWNEDAISTEIICEIKTQLQEHASQIDALLVGRHNRKSIAEWLRASEVQIPVITHAELAVHLEVVPVCTISACGSGSDQFVMKDNLEASAHVVM